MVLGKRSETGPKSNDEKQHGTDFPCPSKNQQKEYVVQAAQYCEYDPPV